jgi:replication factor C large subunit
MSEPWTVKHRPKTVQEIAGNKLAIDKLRQWLDSWSKGRPSKAATLLYGPPGVGKTVVSETVAHDLGWDLVEINASDQRGKDILSKTAGMASTQSTLGSKGRLILLDEVDGINLRQDQGAIAAILQIIKESRFPLVLTANDPWDPKIRPLREACLQIELKQLGVRDAVPFLKTILSKENVAADEGALKVLVQKNNGDLRSTLNDLQVLASRRKSVGLEEVNLLSGRDRTESIFEVLRIVFNSQTVAGARRATNLSDVDHEMLFQWIFENTPYQIQEPLELSNAIAELAKADMFFARIKKTQSWNLLPYALELMTAGVAIAKETPVSGWVPMKFPQRIAAMSRTRAAREYRRSLGAVIGSKTHVSSRRAIQLYMPLIQLVFEHDKTRFGEIGDWLQAKDALEGFLEKDQAAQTTDSA